MFLSGQEPSQLLFSLAKSNQKPRPAFLPRGLASRCGLRHHNNPYGAGPFLLFSKNKNGQSGGLIQPAAASQPPAKADGRAVQARPYAEPERACLKIQSESGVKLYGHGLRIYLITPADTYKHAPMTVNWVSTPYHRLVSRWIWQCQSQ